MVGQFPGEIRFVAPEVSTSRGFLVDWAPQVEFADGIKRTSTKLRVSFSEDFLGEGREGGGGAFSILFL